MKKNKFKIISGSSHPGLAKEISKHLKTDLSEVLLTRFACNEIYVRPKNSVRGKDVYIVQTCTNRVNEDLMELFLLCNSMRLGFAKKIHVVMPHMGYARQDRVNLPREPISAKLVADLLIRSGADHLITFNLHSDQIQGFFDIPVDNINARKIFVDYIKQKHLENIIVVSPDEGGAKAAKKFADQLDCPLAIMHKNRSAHNVSEVTHVVGNIEGKTPIIYDDMIDTAGSVCNAKRVLVEKGAKDEVYLIATHAIFSGPAVERLNNTNFKEIIVTNSICTKDYDMPNLVSISIAPLISEIIHNVSLEKSVSTLF